MTVRRTVAKGAPMPPSDAPLLPCSLPSGEHQREHYKNSITSKESKRADGETHRHPGAPLLPSLAPLGKGSAWPNEREDLDSVTAALDCHHRHLAEEDHR